MLSHSSKKMDYFQSLPSEIIYLILLYADENFSLVNTFFSNIINSDYFCKLKIHSFFSKNQLQRESIIFSTSKNETSLRQIMKNKLYVNKILKENHLALYFALEKDDPAKCMSLFLQFDIKSIEIILDKKLPLITWHNFKEIFKDFYKQKKFMLSDTFSPKVVMKTLMQFRSIKCYQSCLNFFLLSILATYYSFETNLYEKYIDKIDKTLSMILSYQDIFYIKQLFYMLITYNNSYNGYHNKASLFFAHWLVDVYSWCEKNAKNSLELKEKEYCTIDKAFLEITSENPTRHSIMTQKRENYAIL